LFSLLICICISASLCPYST